PLLFAKLVGTGKVGDTVLPFSIGAILMILAGLVEVALGVRAERRSLEDLATPLSAEDAEGHPSGVPGPRRPDTHSPATACPRHSVPASRYPFAGAGGGYATGPWRSTRQSSTTRPPVPRTR